ncbi:MAG: low molecular weight phosphatase family protein [Candidatus Bathyarchaeia archaeon]|jgi:protein-tyrosine-phosphatase
MKVLFVCSGNAFRSPLAEALLKKSRPDLIVDSAGTNVETMISAEARRFLARQNAVQYLKKTPESLDTKRLTEYDVIIAMEHTHESIILQKCPACHEKIIVWNIEDLGLKPYEFIEQIDKQIEEKVSKLAKNL